MVLRSIGVVGLVIVLATAGLATAQSFSMAVTPQSDSATITGGQSSSVSVDVTLQGSDFFCLQAQELPVTVTAAGAQGITASASPAEMMYPVEAGVYSAQDPSGEVASAYNHTESTSISVQAPSGTASGFSAQVQVTATFPGGNYGANQSDPTASGGCGPSEFSAAEGSTAIDINVQPDAADGGTGGDGDDGDGGDGGTPGGDGGGGDDGDDGNGIPLPGWLVPASLIGAALVATRRRAS